MSRTRCPGNGKSTGARAGTGDGGAAGQLFGIGLPDENAHAPDEHIRLENYFGGIKAVAHFYKELANV